MVSPGAKAAREPRPLEKRVRLPVCRLHSQRLPPPLCFVAISRFGSPFIPSRLWRDYVKERSRDKHATLTRWTNPQLDSSARPDLIGCRATRIIIRAASTLSSAERNLFLTSAFRLFAASVRPNRRRFRAAKRRIHHINSATIPPPIRRGFAVARQAGARTAQQRAVQNATGDPVNPSRPVRRKPALLRGFSG